MVTDEAGARTHGDSESQGFGAVAVSFHDAKGWAQGRTTTSGTATGTGGDVDPLVHALRDSVRADLLVVGIAGLPLPPLDRKVGPACEQPDVLRGARLWPPLKGHYVVAH